MCERATPIHSGVTGARGGRSDFVIDSNCTENVHCRSVTAGLCRVAHCVLMNSSCHRRMETLLH